MYTGMVQIKIYGPDLDTNSLTMIRNGTPFNERTVKPVLDGHLQKEKKMVFKTTYHLMQVKSIAECSKGSILQYLRPSLSDHLSLKPLFCLFLSGRFKQVLLYANPSNQLLMSIPKDVSNAYKFVLTFT